ncbi:MAG: aldose 1-epimerase family protein [Solobacterium sp.]|nr:aldose 1-epimerase family protein [Solobacterium sp.]
MAEFEMKNELAYVSVDEHASEITSFRDLSTKTEYMWQGDAGYWKGRNPTLFPVVGSTYDKILHINGKEYVTGNHGFTRNSDFTCIEHTENCIIMELKDSAETLEQYPYHFVLQNRYELDGKQLKITTTVKNTNDEVMPFNFGYHPAFNCPPGEYGNYDDYKLTWNKEETYRVEEQYVCNVTETALNPDDLHKTIVITAPQSDVFSLTNGEHGVRVYAEGYPWVAFWSPHAPFVCIEPWHSHADFEEVRVPFDEREGTLKLGPGEVFSTFYVIEIF